MTALAEYGDYYKKLTDNLMDPLQVQMHQLSLKMVANMSKGALSERLLHSPAMTRNRAPIGFEAPRYEKLSFRETAFPRIGILDERMIGGIAYDPFTLKKRSKRTVLPPSRMTYGSTKQYELNKLVSPGLSLRDQDALQRFRNKQVVKEMKDIEELEKLSRKRDTTIKTYVDETTSIPGMLPASRSKVTSTPVSHHSLDDEDYGEDYDEYYNDDTNLSLFVRGRSKTKSPSSARHISLLRSPSVGGPPDLLTATPERALTDTPENPFYAQVVRPPTTAERDYQISEQKMINQGSKYNVPFLVNEIKKYEPTFRKGDYQRKDLIKKYRNCLREHIVGTAV
jgi:hypothetical protein